MKKALLYSLLGVLFFSSCKKEHSATTDPAQKKYRVSFDASGFSQQVTGSLSGKQQTNALKTNATSGYDVDYLEYLVYAQSGGNQTLVHRAIQSNGTAGFGTVIDSLPSGNYIIYFVAWQKANTVVNVANKVIINTKVPWGDTFFASLTLTVAGANVSQPVTLNRIVGQLSVKLLDTLPSTAKTINISTNEIITDYYFVPGNPITTSGLNHTDTLTASRTGYSYSTFYMNSRPFTVTVSCYDASNKLLGQSIINNVSVIPDRQTILTGYLFGSGTGVSPIVNAGYINTPINAQF